MQLTAYATIISVGGLLVGEAASGTFPAASQTLQGGALAVLAWTVWHLLTKVMPAHQRALERQREDFLEALREQHGSDK